MITAHATLSFAIGTQGWVEQLWLSASSLADALARTLALAEARYAIIGAGCTLYRVRVSQLGTARACLVSTITGRTVSTPSMPAVQGAEVSLTCGAPWTHRRAYVLRGLPQGSVVQGSGRPSWSPQWAGPVQRWLSLLVSGRWCLSVESPVGPEQRIAGITPYDLVSRDVYGGDLPGEISEVYGDQLLAQVVGTVDQTAPLVRIRAARVAPSLPQYRRRVNGLHEVLGRTPRAVWWEGSLGPASYAGSGWLQMMDRGLAPIQSASLSGLAVRAAGRAREYSGEAAPVVETVPAVAVSAGWPVSRLEPEPEPYPDVPGPYRDLETAQDVFNVIAESYVSSTNPQGDLCAIAPVALAGNFPGHKPPRPTFAVFNSGIDTMRSDTFDQLLSALNLGVGNPDILTSQFGETIARHTPSNSNLYFFGHSLGGMSSEWIAQSFDSNDGRRVLGIVTWGSAAMTLLNTTIPLRRFSMPGDPVPPLSPLGYWGYPQLLVALATFGATFAATYIINLSAMPYHTYVDPDGVPLNPFRRHVDYGVIPSMELWSWDGRPIPDGPTSILRIGPITRYPPVPP